MSGAPPPYPGPEKGPDPAYPGPGGVPQYGQPEVVPSRMTPSPHRARLCSEKVVTYKVCLSGRDKNAQYNPPGTANLTANTTVILGQPAAVTVVQQYRESPMRMQCPFCRADIITSIGYETGTFTWVACFIIAVVGFWLGCCLIPFFVNSCKDCVHHCPNCRQQLGRYNRM